MINQVGIDVQSKEIVIHKTDTEKEAGITIWKPTTVGRSEFTDIDTWRQAGSATALDLEQAFREPIPYEIRNYRVAPPEPFMVT